MAEVSPMNPPPLPGPSDELQRVLTDAAVLARKLNGAVKMAGFNGWTMAVLAAMCVPFAWFDATSMVMAVVMAALAWNELRGKAGLMKFDPAAPRRLGWNQVALLAVIAAYCGWSIWLIEADPNSTARQILSDPMLRQQFSGLAESIIQAAMGFYVIVLLVSVLAQGWCARYYFARHRVMAELITSTPTWALDMLRTARMD